MRSKVKDRLFLILTAFISAGMMALIIAVVRPRFSDDWAKFIYTSLGYIVILVSIAYPEYYKRLPIGKVLLFQVVYYLLTTGIAFGIFKFGLLALPKGMLTYVLPMTALALLSLVVLDYLSKKSNLFNGRHHRH